MPLAERPVRSILRAVCDAAARWSDADFPPRVRCLDRIAARTGYAIPVVEYALDRLFGALDAATLASTIASELGSLDALDRFVERPGLPDVRALPIGSVCVLSSRTTIGVALLPAVFALCAKCDVVVKDREDGLVAAYFATLAEELDELGDAMRAEAWSGSDATVDLSHFDAVVAFGQDATLDAIGRGLGARTRYVPYGSAASIGYIARDALTSETQVADLAERAARDLLLYDTQGCLSLHALFVERGGAIAPERFMAVLAQAIERVAVEFPPGDEDEPARRRVSRARDLAAFRAANGGGAAYADARASYLAVLDPPADEAPAFLPRALDVRSVADPREALHYLARHRLPIEALALAGSRDDLVAMAASSGAARIARFGAMQDPPLGDRHGGRPRIAEFVRWISRDR